MFVKRRYLRVKVNFSVRWNIEGKLVSGEGVISNMSVSGAHIITNEPFEPSEGCIFLLKPLPGEVVSLQSHKARMVWAKPVMKDGEVAALECGLEFIKE